MKIIEKHVKPTEKVENAQHLKAGQNTQSSTQICHSNFVAEFEWKIFLLKFSCSNLTTYMLLPKIWFLVIFVTKCYKSVQSFRVHCLFTGQFNTKGYGRFTDVIKSIGAWTSCSSHIIFISGAKHGLWYVMVNRTEDTCNQNVKGSRRHKEHKKSMCCCR